MQLVNKSAIALVLTLFYLLCPGADVLAQSCTTTITVSGASTLCQNGQVVLTASEAASYTWSNGVVIR
jgi:hypothetical protein